MILPAGLLIAVVAFSSPAFGQLDSTRQPSQLPSTGEIAPVAQQLAKLTARSDLVLVPVIVTDKSGKHVAGLQKDAFRIEEDGKVRSVSIFEEIATENPVIKPNPATSEGHSNFLLGDDHAWRITVICLDMINSPWIRQLEAKRQLTEYLLRTALRDEPMAIFGLTSTGLRQLHPFTRDTKVLIGALQRLKLSLSAEESTYPPDSLTQDPFEQQQASDEEQLLSDALSDLDTHLSADYQRIATRETLAGMTQLARAFQAVPGRKTFLWVSAGFPFTIDDPQSFARLGDELRSRYEEAWRSLVSANIAVYPVDLSALEYSATALPSANTGVSSSKIADIRGSNGLARSAMRMPYDKGTEQRLTLRAFAEATGGLACTTINELERCFAEAVDDSRDYYLLGYYLDGDTQPGWRRLKVNVTQGGLRLRYRSGFYVAPKVQDTPEFRRKQLVDALASPVEYTGLRLTARLLPPAANLPRPASTEPKLAEFMLGVMGTSITADTANGNAIDLQVTTVAFDSNRRSVASMWQAVATKFEAERLQKILRTGIGIPEKVELPPGKYEVKFAVRDNLSGLIGTISVPLELN